MGKLSKRQKASKGLLESEKRYGLGEALALLKKTAAPKFDESVDMAIRLGVDPRKADQMIRGSCQLPHGTGKSVRVLVVAKGEKLAEAEEAGADHYGGEELIEKIKGGWLEFDRMVATPDMMAQVGKVGKILGPRGLMPNPKGGTVTPDVGEAVRKAKAGQVQYRTDKAGIIHCTIGTVKFEVAALRENLEALIGDLQKSKPSASKGVYLRKITVSSTMGPGVPVDKASLEV